MLKQMLNVNIQMFATFDVDFGYQHRRKFAPSKSALTGVYCIWEKFYHYYYFTIKEHS